MIISSAMPPALNGSTFVIRNLTSQFSPDIISVVGEMWRKRKTGETNDIIPENYHYVWKQPDFSYRGVNWMRRLMSPFIFWRIWRLVSAIRPQVIVAVFPSEFYLLVGWLVSKLTGAKFYSYFHNTYAENRSGMAGIYARALQSQIFRDSKVVFTMSTGMRDYLRDLYPDYRFEPLVHCYDLANSGSPRNEVSSPLKIAFLGNANSSNWDAFSRFWQAVKSENIQLTILSAQTRKNFEKHGITGKNVLFESIPFRQEIPALQKHDAMFLPHGFTGGHSEAEYKTIFPTKTISFLLSKRPIIAHSPPGSFLSNWLKENRCALLVEDTDPENMRRAVRRLINEPKLRRELVANGSSTVQMFSADRVSKFFAKTLEATSTS